MRLFLAIQLPDAAIEHLRRVQAHCRSFAPDAAYPRDVNLHLTVRFLGETPEEKLEKLKEMLRKTISGGSIRLAASRLVTFPERAPARVLAAGVGGPNSEQLALFYASIERAVRGLGFPAEQKKFTPHVTLARLDRPLPLPAINQIERATLKSWPGPIFEVRRVYLMQSEPSAGGSKYRTVADFDLFGE